MLKYDRVCLENEEIKGYSFQDVRMGRFVYKRKTSKKCINHQLRIEQTACDGQRPQQTDRSVAVLGANQDVVSPWTGDTSAGDTSAG